MLNLETLDNLLNANIYASNLTINTKNLNNINSIIFTNSYLYTTLNKDIKEFINTNTKS